MSHRKTLVASGISVLSVILNKTFTMLNDKGICIVYSGKSAFCLTCGDKALGRKANAVTKIAGNFEIISSHHYLLI